MSCFKKQKILECFDIKNENILPENRYNIEKQLILKLIFILGNICYNNIKIKI